MNDDLISKFASLTLGPDEYVCFLSHHKGAAGKDARLLKSELCLRFRIPRDKIFLDSDQNHLDLNALLGHVRKSKVVLLTQTAEALLRPYMICELATAIEAGIPIVAVNVQNGGYDFEKATEFLSSKNCSESLEREAPGCVNALKMQGIDIVHAGKRLRETIPQIVSAKFDSTELIEAQVKIIAKAMFTAIGTKVSMRDAAESLKASKESEAAAISPATSGKGKNRLTASTGKAVPLHAPKTLKKLRGHTSIINSVAISNDGKYALTGSQDLTARWWNLETGKTLKELRGHTASIFSVAISNDGKYALTGSYDNTARWWNLKTGETLKERKEQSAIFSVAISNDGKYALTGSKDETARWWLL